MQDILPEPVLISLRDHYYAGVMAAEIGFKHNSADEDSVTGALGQALLTLGDRFVELNGQTYGWRADHYKLGGRGRGAPERQFGADGIFQLEVFDELGRVLRRKGLLFQAKKQWRGTDRRLLEQIEKMSEYSPSTIVVNYRNSGFEGIASEDVVAAHGNRSAIPRDRRVSLAETLGDGFVRCREGVVGIFWNPETKTLQNDFVAPTDISPSHVISTTVQRLL